MLNDIILILYYFDIIISYVFWNIPEYVSYNIRTPSLIWKESLRRRDLARSHSVAPFVRIGREHQAKRPLEINADELIFF